MYDSYGRYIGYPEYIITIGNDKIGYHELVKDSKISAKELMDKLDSRKINYSFETRWHSGF